MRNTQCEAQEFVRSRHGLRWPGSLRVPIVARESKDRSVSTDALDVSPCHTGWPLAASVCRFSSSHAIGGRSEWAARPASLAVGAPPQRARRALSFVCLSATAHLRHRAESTPVKTHIQSSLSQPSVSGSRAQGSAPLPAPNPSFKRTCQGLRPCPSA